MVRKIWGKGDTILFIFAGSAAEFALNKAVDWLYYTGKLPADPLGRLFSTVAYSHRILFADGAEAHKAITGLRHIHGNLENSRGLSIPDWAYRDVLFMLIDYSIRAFELLERKLSETEKEEVFDVFYRLGKQMGLTGLPQNLAEWQEMRLQHLHENLENSAYTRDLYQQYRKHLGWLRFQVLRQVQILVAPARVRRLLHLPDKAILAPVLTGYKWSRHLHLDGFIRSLFLPPAYAAQIKALDQAGRRE
ncbi:MAG: oxygenase MpaB family protein [Adhaeribacter sp.]